MDRDKLIRSRRKARRRRSRLRRAANKLTALIARRTRQIKELGGRRKEAVNWALSKVGVVERPPGSNSGPQISDWIRAGGGIPVWPWCQYFANQVLVAGGLPQLKSGYTVAVVQWARTGQHGLRLVPKADVRPGDMVFFKFPGVSSAFCDHVGVSIGGGKTVEGNTSPGTTGSQNNGGGVFIRTRPSSYVVAVVRPPYK